MKRPELENRYCCQCQKTWQHKNTELTSTCQRCGTVRTLTRIRPAVKEMA